MARVLVTRPQGLAEATAARLVEWGHEVIISPLLEPTALAWTPPPGPIDALVFTSAQAPQLAGDLGPYLARPAYAVGLATAQAARKAGFVDVRIGSGDAKALFTQAAHDGMTHLLHLAGRDHRPPPPHVMTRIVYAADLARDFTDVARTALLAGMIDWVLLYSARTAAHFRSLCDRHNIGYARLRLAAISPAAARAAASGWARLVVGDRPAEDAIFAAAGLSCDKRD